MASVQVAINVVGLDSKLGFSSNATHALTGTGHSANVVTVAGTEYELDLSGVGDGGLLVLRNGGANHWAGTGWKYNALLFGFAAGKYVSRMNQGQSIAVPLLPAAQKFYMRAYLSTVTTVLPAFTANASTDALTFASTHGLEVGDGIFVWTEGTLPGGLVDGTRYIVKTVDGMDVTLEDGASTLDVTSAGTGPHWAVEADAVAACPVSYLFSEA
jgi:hypothetical protein